MPVFMVQAAYTADAWANLVKQPEDRRVAIGAVVERAKGKLLDLYFSFGDNDIVFLFEAPDAIAAAAVSVAATSAGHIKNIRTTQLLTVEESLALMRTAQGLGPARPPSG